MILLILGFYPHPKSVQIHNNEFSRSGSNPDLDKDIASILYEISDGDMPDIFWDGVLPLKQMILGQPNNEKLIIKDNGKIDFAVMNPIRYMFHCHTSSVEINLNILEALPH
ncbi:MAG: hypothetical protein Ct9H90mP13_12200 [Pseudomonadota bacterium]|nr:MAG: hypothetical protein Ct9H90mP13_12200 [Pseudomonadota bacterium]